VNVHPLASALVASIAVTTAGADDGFRGEPQDIYGTASLSVYSIGGASFTPATASAALEYTITGITRTCLFGGACGFVHSPFLPNGAQLERMELLACDAHMSQSVTVTTSTCPTNGGPCVVQNTVDTGVAAMPGCATFTANLALVVNNLVPMVVSVNLPAAGGSLLNFSAVRLYYRLRVSPAPAVATFPNDVPTNHPFFRFVEALAAAGVTGGCGAGSYCPDAAVTRGQMAVFLATALGLHFPN
jgi:hypothetical protein